MSQVEDSYKSATGRAIPSVPKAMSWFITETNKSTQELYISLYMYLRDKSNCFVTNLLRRRIGDIERHHHARTAEEYPELQKEIRLANQAFKMRGYFEWAKEEKKEEGLKEGWNKLSVAKLLAGRF